MHMEILVEELSAQEALGCILPQILGDAATHDIHVYQGKPDLLKKLPGRLRGYSRWLQPDWRILVLVDNHHEDCRALKARLEREAAKAGLMTKSSPRSGRLQVLNRIVMEELEAWLLGDLVALQAAFPDVPGSLHSASRFRDPDSMRRGACEALEKLLQKAGYYKAGLPKVEAARRIAKHMDPDRNRSRSFQVFREGLLYCMSAPGPAPATGTAL